MAKEEPKRKKTQRRQQMPWIAMVVHYWQEWNALDASRHNRG
jgi:hypothetical protein